MGRWRTRAPSSTAGWTRCSSRTTATRPSQPGAWRRRRWPAGRPSGLAYVKRVMAGFPDVLLLVGSGVTAETVAELLSVADGAIVGTAVKRDGDVRNPVDRARVERLVAAARRC